jgi:DNA-directed RNA polymerase II subunit RPB4
MASTCYDKIANRPARQREEEEVEEDAGALKFGKEFEGVQCLFMAEVEELLKHRAEGPVDVNPVFERTLDYVSRFGRYKNSASVRQAGETLRQHSDVLHTFEMASIANLGPDTPEEAIALIPSLADKVEDDELQHVLDDLANLRS